jgi:glutaconate CoA-transferase subunit B
VPVTPAPSAETLRLLRQTVAPMLAEVYPQFSEKVFGVHQSLYHPELVSKVDV